MGLASVNLTQLTLKAAVMCEITRNDSHLAVQDHSVRSPILVAIDKYHNTLSLESGLPLAGVRAYYTPENLTKTQKNRWPDVRIHQKLNGWRTRIPKNN